MTNEAPVSTLPPLVVVVGSRSFLESADKWDWATSYLERWFQLLPPEFIFISGGAIGIDVHAEVLARRAKQRCRIYYRDGKVADSLRGVFTWGEPKGPRAPLDRNTYMMDDVAKIARNLGHPVVGIGLRDSQSPTHGTDQALKEAKRNKLKGIRSETWNPLLRGITPPHLPSPVPVARPVQANG